MPYKNFLKRFFKLPKWLEAPPPYWRWDFVVDLIYAAFLCSIFLPGFGLSPNSFVNSFFISLVVVFSLSGVGYFCITRTVYLLKSIPVFSPAVKPKGVTP